MAAALPAFIGRYEVKQRLGQGGMGVIYLARDPAIDRLVAVKLLDPDITTDELRQRFAQEARSSGALAHPHIVTIHDFGEVDGVPYLVMEYVQGETMAAIIKRAAPIPVAQKLRWIEQACRALGYAHQRRVIHRDVKPSNLMIDEHGTVKVVDFGIARSLGGGTTKLSTVIGTPAYMSPEQIQGGGIDARSDIFGLGTVLYELLTYKTAFGGESPHAIMHRVVSGQPQPLTELLTGPDLSIAAVVDTAMQKSPDARFADMAQFEAAIRQARTALEASGREITIRTPGLPANDRNQSRRRRTDPADLARRRAEQIAVYLQDAQRARRDGKLEAAIVACENALLMDPASVEALDLIEELRQESTGAALPATSPITAAAPPTRVTAPLTRPPDARPARTVDLADMELRPRSVQDRPTVTGMAQVGPVSITAPTSRRSRWPLVSGIVIALVAAAALAVQRGLVSFDGASEESEAVELAMPAVPDVSAVASTPAPAPRATPPAPPVASSPPSQPSVSDVATIQREPDAPAASPVEEPPAPNADSPPLEPAPNEPPAKVAPDALPETPPVVADAPADTETAPIDREAVARLLLRGEGAERNGNLGDALNQYRDVLKLDPRNRIAERAVLRIRVDMILRRAESQVLVGNYDAALKELAAVAVYDPTNARAEELREAIEQGRKNPARKRPGS